MNNRLGRFIRAVGLGAMATVAVLAFDPITDDSGIYVVVWERGTIPMVNNLPNASVLLVGMTFRGSAEAAMAEWNGQMGNVQFTWSYGPEGVYETGNDVNEIAVDSTIGGFEFGDTTLAVTLSFSDGGNYRTESDVVFNSRWEWDSYRGAERNDAFDAHRVAVHEFGHVLGLGHPDQAEPAQSVDAIMNSTAGSTDGLRSDDITGVQSLYGAPNSPPDNDNFADATRVAFGTDSTVVLYGSNIQSSGEANDPVLDEAFPGGRTVWWKWTAPTGGELLVTTLGSRFDTIMGIFQGATLDGLIEVGTNDDVDPGVIRTSQLSIEVDTGETYYVLVDGWDGYEGSLQLNFDFARQTGPAVSVGANRLLPTLGESVTLSASATPLAGGALSYQWRKDNRAIAGAMAANYTIPFFANSDAGAYSVMVSEAGGGVSFGLVFVLPDYQETEVVVWGSEATQYLIPLPDFQSPAIQVESGYYHALALQRDGVVMAWGGPTGGNAQGQENVPSELSNVVSIAAGPTHSLALRADGTVVAWGDDRWGESTVPTGLRRVVAISAGLHHSVALRADGRVVGWGYDLVEVPREFDDGVAISAGVQSVAALRSDGTPAVWGDTNNSKIDFPQLPPLAKIAVGNYHVVAVTREGEVRGWGNNISGQLEIPADLYDVADVETGYVYSMALKHDGTIIEWGRGVSDAVPAGLDRVLDLSGGASIALALRHKGETRAPVFKSQPAGVIELAERDTLRFDLEAWGDNPFSYTWKKDGVTLVNGRRIKGAHSPRLSIVELELGDAGSYTLEVSNAAGTVTTAASQVTVRPLPTIEVPPRTQVALAGGSASFAVTASDDRALQYQWRRDGEIIAGATSRGLVLPAVSEADAGRYEVWVSSEFGTVISQCFLRVARPDSTVIFRDFSSSSHYKEQPGGLAGVGKVDTNDHALALLSDGSVSAWGAIRNGRLNVPEDLGRAVDVAVDGDRSFALKADGTVATWGEEIELPADLQNVVALESHGALLADGTVRTWGGVGSPPVGLRDVVQLSVGGSVVAAVKRDGSIVAWDRWGERAVSPAAMPAGRIKVGNDTILVQKVDGSMYFTGRSAYRGVDFAGLRNVAGFDHGGTGGVAWDVDGNFTAWHENGSRREDWPFFTEEPLQVSMSYADAVVVVAEAPVVGSMAGSAELDESEVLELSVELMSGTGPFIFNWYRSGVLLAESDRVVIGSDGTLRIDPAQSSDSGVYTVSVVNAGGVAAVEGRTVTVRGRPNLVHVPVHRHVAVGDAVVLDMTTTGTGTSYQWFHDGVELTDQTDAILEIPSATLADAGYYTIVLTSPFGGERRVVTHVDVVRRGLTVASWGGYQGQLTTTPAGLTDIVQFSARSGHVLALTRTGDVLAWGNSFSGETLVPATVDEVVEVGSGTRLSLALRRDGSVVSWGTRGYHDFRVSDDHPPMVTVKSNSQNAFGLSVEGEVYAWTTGDSGAWRRLDVGRAIDIEPNWRSEVLVLLEDHTVEEISVGNSGPSSSDRPTDLANVIGVAAADSSHLALTTDGQVVQWLVGFNPLPPVPADVVNVRSIAAGYSHALALLEDGSIRAWGDDQGGQSTVPDDLPEADAIEASGSSSFALVPAEAGRIRILHHPKNFVAAGGDEVTLQVEAVSGAGELSYQWLRNGVLLVNGADISGAQSAALTLAFATSLIDGEYTVQLTDEAETISTLPADVSTVVSGDAPIFNSRPLSKRVREGDSVSVTADVSGAVRYEWWRNGAPLFGSTGPTLTLSEVSSLDEGTYELLVAGEGGVVARSVFKVLVTLTHVDLVASASNPVASYVIPADVGEVVDIYTGALVNYVLRADGTMKGWGSNSSDVIETVGTLTNVLDFDAFSFGYAALRNDGGVITSNSTWNVSLESLAITDAVDLVMGFSHVLILRADGTVVGVGDDYYDQVTVPPGLGEVVKIAAGGYHSLALQADGSVVHWGRDSDGVKNVPTDLSGVVAIDVGWKYGVAQLRDGTLRTWGNSYELPALPADLGPVRDFEVTGYDMGVVRITGEAEAYRAQGVATTLLSDWSDVRRISVGSTNYLGLVSNLRPVITQEPTDLIVSKGGEARFEVAATGIGDLRYQWSRDGVDLTDGDGVSGAQSAVLVIGAPGTADIGHYVVAITDDHGRTTTSPVSLLFTTPVILTQPLHTALAGGQSVTLTVGAVAPGPITYQWYRGNSGSAGIPLPGENGAQLNLAGDAASGRVWVRASNDAGVTDSDTVRIIPFVFSDTGTDTGSPVTTGYGNGQFLVLGTLGGAISSDLESWQSSSVTNGGQGETIFANGIFLRGRDSTINQIYFSEDGFTWGSTSGYQAGSTIKDIAYNGSRLVAVSNVAGYSEDGMNWTAGAGFPADAVVWGEDRFVALGYGKVRVSSDGINWQAGEVPPTVAFQDVVYGDGMFVATSFISTQTAVWYSRDGYTWSRAKLVNQAEFSLTTMRLAYGNGMFVGVPVSSRRRSYSDIYLSTDGINWIKSTAGYSQAVDVVFGGGRFLIREYEGGLRVSDSPPEQVSISNLTPARTILAGEALTLSVEVSDPAAIIQWYEGSSGDTSKPVAEGDGETVTVSFDTTTDYWVRVTNSHSSVDSPTVSMVVAEAPEWTVEPRGNDALSGDTVILTAGVTGVPVPELQWFVGETGDTSHPIAGATEPTLTVAVGQQATNYWLRVRNMAGELLGNMATVTPWRRFSNWNNLRVFEPLNGEIVGVFWDGFLTANSRGGWEPERPDDFPAIRDLAHGEDTYVAASENGKEFFTSADLRTWTERSLPTGTGVDRVFDVVHAFGQFWAGTAAAGQLLKSSDGIGWDSVSMGVPAADVEVRAWWVDADGVVGVGADYVNNSVAIVRSVNGTTWQRVDLAGEVAEGGSFNGLDQIVRAGGRFYAWESTRGTLLSSVDGRDWKKLDPTTAGLGSRLVGFGRLGANYVAADESGNFYRSWDGLSWTKSSTAVPRGLQPNGLVSLPGRILIEGEGFIWETVDLDHWILRAGHPSKSHSFDDAVVGSGVFVTSDFWGADYYSTDGEIWNATIDEIGRQGGGRLGYGAEVFLAADTDQQGGIWRSTDGSQWTYATIDEFGSTVVDFAYLNDRWFALGEGGQFAHSEDGLAWTLGDVAGGGGTHYAIAYGNGRYLITADRDIWMSTDLVDWSKTASLENIGFSLIHDRGLFVVAGGGNRGKILTSPDGVVWTERYDQSNNGLYALVSDGRRFFAASSDGVLVSEDALTWRETQVPSASNLSSDGADLVASASELYIRVNPEIRPVTFSQPLFAGAAVIGHAVAITADVQGDFTRLAWKREGGLVVNGPRILGANSETLVISNLSESDAGLYELIATDGAGNSVSRTLLIEVVSRPEVVSQPVSVSLEVGSDHTLAVTATGGSLAYEWMKDGVVLSDASERTLDLSQVGLSDAGRYQVRVSNGGGSVVSAAVFVAVFPSGVRVAATHEVSTARNVPGDALTVTNGVTWSGPVEGITYSVLLPEGWSLASADAPASTLPPKAGDLDLLEWSWTTIPTSPFTFDYSLTPPTTFRRAVEIVGMIEVQLGTETIQVLVSPDPLSVHPPIHSADVDGDQRLSLSELLRVIELYNTRFGSARTGRYGLSESTPDGFDPDGRDPVQGEVNGRFHSADVDRDGRLSLSELLRVIELYNTRSGSTRTGAYRIESGTADGFAPGPE